MLVPLAQTHPRSPRCMSSTNVRGPCSGQVRCAGTCASKLCCRVTLALQRRQVHSGIHSAVVCAQWGAHCIWRSESSRQAWSLCAWAGSVKSKRLQHRGKMLGGSAGAPLVPTVECLRRTGSGMRTPCVAHKVWKSASVSGLQGWQHAGQLGFGLWARGFAAQARCNMCWQLGQVNVGSASGLSRTEPRQMVQLANRGVVCSIPSSAEGLVRSIWWGCGAAMEGEKIQRTKAISPMPNRRPECMCQIQVSYGVVGCPSPPFFFFLGGFDFCRNSSPYFKHYTTHSLAMSIIPGVIIPSHSVLQSHLEKYASNKKTKCIR